MRPSRRQTQIFPRPWADGRPSATVLIVASLAGAFVSQWLIGFLEADFQFDPHWLDQWLALDGKSFVDGQWWQFLTFGFLHANLLHLLASLLLVYFAGREVEPIIGWKQTLSVFALGQLVGGIVHTFAMPEVALVGASAGAAALVAVFATTLPELEVVGHLFFVVPLKLRAKYFGLGLALICVLGWLTWNLSRAHHAGAFAQIGPAAAFVGCLAGWIVARRLGFGRPFWFQRMVYDHRQREARLARMPAEQFITEEIDPILEKIAQSGMASLTRAERKLLERGKAKMDTKRR